MKVPVLDLREQYAGIRSEILSCVEQMLDSSQFILGPAVGALENDLVNYLKVQDTIGVTSGTDALWLALKALDIGPGDKVLTSPFTFFATVSAILNVGAQPVFADIDPLTFNLCPEKTEDVLRADKNHAIKAIVPIHLYGQPAEMNAFVTLGKRYRCAVIEDAAQAIGAQYHEKMVGGMGELGCFSFFPTKNLGSLGDAGLVSTQDSALAAKVRSLRTHGSTEKYFHDQVGSNCRIDTLQAAFLRIMLPHLNGWIAARQRSAQYYDEHLKKYVERVEIPHRIANGTHVFHQYTLRVKGGQRESLRRFLTEMEIGNAIYYPLPCHLQKALKSLAFTKGMFPESERAAEEVLSIPNHPNLTQQQQDYVIDAIKKWTTC